MQLRVRALETVLTEKGYVEPAALDAIVQAYETKIGPHNGARVVAKAWSDPAFKRLLLEDATKAVGTLGHVSRVGDHLVAVENTPQRHNMVVCTLCSCYPWEMLGLPPVWYKAAPYRSRAVKDPRGVLADFGVTLPKETEIRVWDSTAETRFLVLPMRPADTDGWSEQKLAELVTRDDRPAMAKLAFRAPAPLARFIAAKGSVALDGVSLTVNEVDGERFTVLIIPHTLEVTTLAALRAGDLVNLEVDVMARYAARLMETP